MWKKILEITAYVCMAFLVCLAVAIFGIILLFHMNYLERLPNYDEIDQRVRNHSENYVEFENIDPAIIEDYVTNEEPNYWDKHLPDWTNFFDSEYPGSPWLTHVLVKKYFDGNFDYEDRWWSEQIRAFAFTIYMDNKVYYYLTAQDPELKKEKNIEVLDRMIKEQLLEWYLNIESKD